MHRLSKMILLQDQIIVLSPQEFTLGLLGLNHIIIVAQELHCPIEPSVIMKTLHIGIAQYGSQQLHVAVEHLNLTNAPEKLTFWFYLILVKFTLKSHIWLMATVSETKVIYS